MAKAGIKQIAKSIILGKSSFLGAGDISPPDIYIISFCTHIANAKITHCPIGGPGRDIGKSPTWRGFGAVLGDISRGPLLYIYIAGARYRGPGARYQARSGRGIYRKKPDVARVWARYRGPIGAGDISRGRGISGRGPGRGISRAAWSCFREKKNWVEMGKNPAGLKMEENWKKNFEGFGGSIRQKGQKKNWVKMGRYRGGKSLLLSISRQGPISGRCRLFANGGGDISR